jgi:hypothetical protein
MVYRAMGGVKPRARGQKAKMPVIFPDKVMILFTEVQFMQSGGGRCR